MCELLSAQHVSASACAKRGVRVRFLFDRVGSHKLPKTYLEALEKAGVKTINVHAQTGPHSRFQINFRNHRKTVVVDGTCGFTGGLNVLDEAFAPIFPEGAMAFALGQERVFMVSAKSLVADTPRGARWKF